MTARVDAARRAGYGRPVRRLSRQFLFFAVAGAAATLVHYGLLVGLVESGAAGPVAGALACYCGGGIVSYLLNRRLAFGSDRRHREAVWRFGVVAAVGFGLTGLAMALLTRQWLWPYLPAQVATTGLVMVWSFTAHRLWTFGTARAVPAPPLAASGGAASERGQG
jgi:putative flippase GtrA